MLDLRWRQTALVQKIVQSEGRVFGSCVRCSRLALQRWYSVALPVRRQTGIFYFHGGEVEVRDGLRSGDRVILCSPVDVAEGAKVQMARPRTPLS